MDSTYRFYICSTFSDLQEERKAVIDIISRLNQTSVAYEYFPASNEPPFEIAKSFIDSSDYIIMIIGTKYGIPDTEGVSYVEAEYNYAISKNKPILPFIFYIDDNDESIPIQKSMRDFRKRILDRQLVSFWTSIDDLKMQVLFALTSLLQKENNKQRENCNNNFNSEKSNNTIYHNEDNSYKEELKSTLGIYTSKENSDIIGLMADNLNEIRQFYKLTKEQAINAYKLAKNSSIAGIFLIIIAILVAIIFDNNQIAVATTAGGIIVEVLAGTSLFVYQKTLKQLNYYYSSLHNNERFLSLINIVGKTDIKDELYSKIVESELDNLKKYEIKNDKTQ